MKFNRTTIPCPLCGLSIGIPITVTTSPVHGLNEIRLNVEPDYSELRAHAETHRPPDGPGLSIAS